MTLMNLNNYLRFYFCLNILELKKINSFISIVRNTEVILEIETAIEDSYKFYAKTCNCLPPAALPATKPCIVCNLHTTNFSNKVCKIATA